MPQHTLVSFGRCLDGNPPRGYIGQLPAVDSIWSNIAPSICLVAFPRNTEILRLRWNCEILSKGGPCDAHC